MNVDGNKLSEVFRTVRFMCIFPQNTTRRVVFLFYFIDFLVQGIPDADKILYCNRRRVGHDTQGDGVLDWGEGGLLIRIGILAEVVPLIESDAAFGKVVFGEFGFQAEGLFQQRCQFL